MNQKQTTRNYFNYSSNVIQCYFISYLCYDIYIS